MSNYDATNIHLDVKQCTGHNIIQNCAKQLLCLSVISIGGMQMSCNYASSSNLSFD